MAALIHSDPRVCDRRLRQYFNSTREQWIEIVKSAVAARAGCTENDARSAPGYLAWNAGTVRARQIFRREGWEKGDHNGIETIWNSDLKKMVAVMNTDAGTCDTTRTPRNRTLKGSASEQIADFNSQGLLFKREEMGPLDEAPYSLWYLCIHDDGGKVRAELSMPIEYQGGYVTKFSERIFILRDGEWEKIILETDVDADHQDFEINVRRK
ncbi:MAG TPA: hypothetical protein VNW53_10940 [Phenylobacterium sp.]|jgi:hypothetical protein|uniref:hypothetical protein n=1 Tax=Phenylobacterium sp. TaxID=1871053 RepID=UPI002C560634|nr:hypothetical protein [Phenylobacterium sp.]HXA39507.1 hypothetical protein [Phenylobacterium sp.]